MKVSWILDACVQLSATLTVTQKGAKEHGRILEGFLSCSPRHQQSRSTICLRSRNSLSPTGKSLEIPTSVHPQATSMPRQKDSALVCMIQTPNTCNKRYVFSSANLALSNLMVGFIFSSLHLNQEPNCTSHNNVNAGHHHNNFSGTTGSKCPRDSNAPGTGQVLGGRT